MAEPDYFSLVDFRDVPDMSDPAKYSDERILASAAYITGIIEREIGTSFVGRTVTDEAHDGGTDRIVLNRRALSATSATENGVAVTDALVVRAGVLVRLASANASTPISWASGFGNVKVTYVSGYSLVPPADVKEQAINGTRAHLMSTSETSSINDRRTSLNTDMGVINYVVAGENRPTGYPEVDAMILGWKRRLDVLGFA